MIAHASAVRSGARTFCKQATIREGKRVLRKVNASRERLVAKANGTTVEKNSRLIARNCRAVHRFAQTIAIARLHVRVRTRVLSTMVPVVRTRVVRVRYMQYWSTRVLPWYSYRRTCTMG